MDLRTSIHLLTTLNTPSKPDTDKSDISKKLSNFLMVLAFLAIGIMYSHFKKSITNESIVDILFNKGNIFEMVVVGFFALLLTVFTLSLVQKVKTIMENPFKIRIQSRWQKNVVYSTVSFL